VVDRPVEVAVGEQQRQQDLAGPARNAASRSRVPGSVPTEAYAATGPGGRSASRAGTAAASSAAARARSAPSAVTER
jgi:hypothetical protein